MYRKYRVYTPDLNAAPVLWRAVRCLCGTRELIISFQMTTHSEPRLSATLYTLAKKLARVLSIPLSLHRSLASSLKRSRQRDPNWHKHDDAIPEVALVAVVIVVLKMVYGLDDKRRQTSFSAIICVLWPMRIDTHMIKMSRLAPYLKFQSIWIESISLIKNQRRRRCHCLLPPICKCLHYDDIETPLVTNKQVCYWSRRRTNRCIHGLLRKGTVTLRRPSARLVLARLLIGPAL